MKDDTGRDMVVGDLIMFATSHGRSDATLGYGRIIKLNKRSVVVQQLNPNLSVMKKIRYERNPDGSVGWAETSDDKAPRLVNYTHANKFHIC